MTLRGRLLIAFTTLGSIPLITAGLVVRKALGDRLEEQFERRVNGVVHTVQNTLLRETQSVSDRLAGLVTSIENDNRLRSAIARSDWDDPYLLDYAGQSMQLLGLAMLEIQDSDGRVLSSGHFRNEYGKVDDDTPRALLAIGDNPALMTVHTAASRFLALAATNPFTLGSRRFVVTGAIRVDQAFLETLSGDEFVSVIIATPTDSSSIGSSQRAVEPNTAVTRDVEISYVSARPPNEQIDVGLVRTARLSVSHSTQPLQTVRRELDFWFGITLGITILVAAAAAIVMSTRLSRPLADLADKTSHIDLDRLNVDFTTSRTDEVGSLARLLGQMVARLRRSMQRLRDAERLAAVGDLARQVNHDLKNGLTPIRNVLRHLRDVQRRQPHALSSAFEDRVATIESSLEYLETLASNYARLAPDTRRGQCDINEVVTRVAEQAHRSEGVYLQLDLSTNVRQVRGDAIAVRRVFENLVGNALDSVAECGGTVTLQTHQANRDVCIIVADTGRGMTEQQLEQAFQAFHTTKAGGTGLGLTIVRRLVADLGGSLRVETEPQVGTRIAVTLPSASPSPLSPLPGTPTT